MSGYTYVPHSAIKKEFFKPTDTQTVCGVKGTAHYYTIQVGETKITDACWYYPVCSRNAKAIENWVGFYEHDGVTVTRK